MSWPPLLPGFAAFHSRKKTNHTQLAGPLLSCVGHNFPQTFMHYSSLPGEGRYVFFKGSVWLSARDGLLRLRPDQYDGALRAAVISPRPRGPFPGFRGAVLSKDRLRSVPTHSARENCVSTGKAISSNLSRCADFVRRSRFSQCASFAVLSSLLPETPLQQRVL
jgi:hypothetical protein